MNDGMAHLLIVSLTVVTMGLSILIMTAFGIENKLRQILEELRKK